MPTPSSPEPTPGRGKTVERVIFGACLLGVVVLVVVLVLSLRSEPKYVPTPVVTPPRRLMPAPVFYQPASAPASQGAPAPVPASQVNKPPPELPPIPPALRHLPLVLVDGGWQIHKSTGPRMWTEFQAAPPSRFVSEEEGKRFREYWMKEATTRVGIYCELTKVCPDPDDVNRILAGLFDNAVVPAGGESFDEAGARRQRWADAMGEWREKFGTPPQSVFSFAGLEQHRGPDQPKPPLEPDHFPDAGVSK